MTTDFPISGFPASASSPLSVFKEATTAKDPDAAGGFPRRPHPLPGSTPSGPSRVLCLSCGLNPAFPATRSPSWLQEAQAVEDA